MEHDISANLGTHENSLNTPPFEAQETFHKIVTSEDSSISPLIHAKVNKGFFFSSDRQWSCYRRNYFCVECSYSLEPEVLQQSLFLEKSDSQSSPQQIQAIAMTLNASIVGELNRPIRIIQHTPKRDKGPEFLVPKIKLWPVPKSSDFDASIPSQYITSPRHLRSPNFPHLPLQQLTEETQLAESEPREEKMTDATDASSSMYSPIPPNNSTTHTFERIQFKNATANNGKRRAAQQFYRLTVVLMADIRSSSSKEAIWVTIAQSSTCPLVVRGRSPSHYQNDGPYAVERPSAIGAPTTTYDRTEAIVLRSGWPLADAAGRSPRFLVARSPWSVTDAYPLAIEHGGFIPGGEAQFQPSYLTLPPSQRNLHESFVNPLSNPVTLEKKDVQKVDSDNWGPWRTSGTNNYRGYHPLPSSHETAAHVDEPTHVHADHSLPLMPNLPRGHEHRKTPAPDRIPSADERTPAHPFEETILDDSSVSSVHSGNSTSRHKSSISSITSFGDIGDAAERLANFIFESTDIKDIAQVCFAIEDSYRTERNIQRLLKILARYLAAEASTKSDLTIARTLKRHSKKVAHSMRVLSAPKPTDSHKLPLKSIPEAQNYSLQQFLNSNSSSQQAATSFVNRHHQFVAEERPEHPSQFRKAITVNRSKADMMTNWSANQVSDEDQSDSDEEKSEGALAEPALDSLTTGLANELAKAKHFFQRSEALEEFREGLLDFREALRNSQHNRRVLESSQRPNSSHRNPEASQSTTNRLSLLLRKIQMVSQWIRRPSVKPGFRRLEWTCECGKSLYADFGDKEQCALGKLERDLHAISYSPGVTNQAAPDATHSTIAQPQRVHTRTESHLRPESTLPQRSDSALKPSSEGLLNFRRNRSAMEPDPEPKYVATCVSTGGIYKVLTEIDVSQIKSDTEFFLAVRKVYQNIQAQRRRWKILFKPITVEFVQFTVWSLQQGYISICDRSECIPPAEDSVYEFSPRPMAPLPPVPPEIFIHYLQHTHHDSGFSRFVWVPRMPKRVASRIIDSPVPSYGWGVFVKEGLNGTFLFWAILVISFCSILLAILWSWFKADVQGGSGLGTLLLGLVSIVLGAIIFKVDDKI